MKLRSVCAAIVAAFCFLVSPPERAEALIISGAWVSNCVDISSGSYTLACDRYAGPNETPPGCRVGSSFLCENMTLCQLSTYLTVLSSTEPPTFDQRIFECSANGVVDGRQQVLEFGN